MGKENSRNAQIRPRKVSRREFIKLAAMAGLLAGCSPRQPATVTEVTEPASAPALTNTPPPAPTRTPMPTSTPLLTPTPAVAIRRPEVIKMYPDVPSKVVHTHHKGVWDGETLVPGAMRQMLDASITGLTGLNDARAAWAALFAPDERVAIKVNVFRNSLIWTHIPLVMAVTECLQEAGVPAEQIFIFDYYTREFEDAGYPINKDGPGVRCYGTDMDYTAGWKVKNARVELSNILLNCNALINMPVLKSHMISGLSFAMKNHYGTVSRPDSIHTPIGPCMAELNALGPIQDRTRLIIGDVLEACLRYASSYPYWHADFTGDSIFMSFDPVAHDTMGLQTFSQLLTADGGNPEWARDVASLCLEAGAELGLGTNDPHQIELVELNLG